MSQRTCAATPCVEPVGPHGARGWCLLHYGRWRKYGDPRAGVPNQRHYAETLCELADCEKPRYGTSRMCVTHHMRRWRYGDPLADKQKRRGVCKIEGCGAPHSSLGWCKKHYTRWERHGDPLAVYPKARYPDRRYRSVRRRGHPLARRDGSVALHRFVLYEAIGPGAHPCHWCGTLVEWEQPYPQSVAALVVDHLDWNRANNQLTNLVPSCSRCNTTRQHVA